jgi:hypothetical protein
MDAVSTIFGEKPSCRDCIFQDLPPFHVFDSIESKEKCGLRADLPPNFLQHLEGKGRPSPCIAAIPIVSRVRERREELAYQVKMGPVNLNPFKTSRDCAAGRFRKANRDLFNLYNAHGKGVNIRSEPYPGRRGPLHFTAARRAPGARMV